MGLVNCRELDTHAGKNNPFSPPPGWSGNRADYIELMRSRNRTAEGFQHFFAAARQKMIENNVQFCGPFSDVAEKMLGSVCNQIQHGSLT